jgi:uncharacterized protein (TIGR02453 family)
VAAALSPETFRFLRDLARNNRKAWMDAHRARYQEHVVAPLRCLVEALAPSLLALDPGFAAGMQPGKTLSRINRDIRFAADKTPYHTRLYVQFSNGSSLIVGGQLFVAVGPRDVTAGFRVYGGSRDSALRTLGRARALDNPAWLARQARRLGRRYESYWYATVKGTWTKQPGFPAKPEQWGRLLGFVVRRGFAPAAAVRSGFSGDVAKTFEELFPLYAFTSLPG